MAPPSADDAKIGELRALSSQLLTSVRGARGGDPPADGDSPDRPADLRRRD